jgi:hypothetical protein
MASRSREDIITNMCMTWRHDYGLDRDECSPVPCGMTPGERAQLWRQMAQIFDNDIAPFMEYKNHG